MSAIVSSVRAVMARRILVNYRVRPEVLERLVPKPFRVKVVKGWGLAGICLIRLESMRPDALPAALGLSSENAAHRIAVEWDDEEGPASGVFIPRRDTNSWFSGFAGGRLFPGVQGLASFAAREEGPRIEVSMQSQDGGARVRVEVEIADRWPQGSLFETLEQASDFFRGGCRGWSPTWDGRELEGAELEPEAWSMTPLAVRAVESSYFTDPRRFPPGTVELDSAVLMRGIAHTWRDLGRMPVGPMARRLGRARVHGTHGASALFRMP